MQSFIILAVVGFFAQLVDGSLGMAYGVTSSTLLLASGIAPAAASAAVHFSEIGTTLISGISHHKLGNVDWRTVSILAVPGAIGAFVGATLLTNISGDTAKPWVSGILLALGIYVIYRFLILRGERPKFPGKVSSKFLVPLGFTAGTLDAIGGGGWGPLGTTSLLSSGRLEPRKVIGSIDTSEFLVAVGGSLGFLIGLGSAGIDWKIVTALLLGGVIAAPIAAWLVKHLSANVLGVAAGGLIILTNLKTLLPLIGVTNYWPILAILALIWLGTIGVTVRAHKSVNNELKLVGS